MKRSSNESVRQPPTKREPNSLPRQKSKKRDKRLFALETKSCELECASITMAPAPRQALVGEGWLTVQYESCVLYLLDNKDGTYYRGGSELHLSIHHEVNGQQVFDKDGWFQVFGKPHKLQISSNNPDVLAIDPITQKLNFVPTTLYPKRPGYAVVTVSLAAKSIKIPIWVVPLTVAFNESSDAVIQRLGMPDDTLSAFALWPNTESVHNLVYYDNADHSDNSATHWKYDRFPGAVLAVRLGKVVNVSTTSPEYPWPKVQRQRWR